MTRSKKTIPIYRKQLGTAVRIRREEKHLSQEKLAELAEVHRNYIGLVERGEQNLTVDMLVRISKSLDCHPCDILSKITL